MSNKEPKIVMAGSVNSSKKTLEKLIEHNMNISGILALSPDVSKNVSGYVDLGEIASEHNLNFKYFKSINSLEVEEFITQCAPDYMFVVGLSQLVKKPLLSIPKFGSVGFHPTKLPKGRGRGAVAWLILGKATGAATFFLMGEGMDDGPILAQEEFEISDEDYASDVINRIIDNAGRCLDKLLPEMKLGQVTGCEQDQSQATYLGKRNPEDGLIVWENSAEEIHRLIRAVSDPLPGAYTYYKSEKIIVKRAVIETVNNYAGVVGRVLKNDNNGVLVQTGDGLIRLTEILGLEITDLQVGKKLGNNYDERIAFLEQELETLKNLK